MDRQLLAEYENPTTVLLSLRVERAVSNRVSLLRELSVALEPTLDALRYRLDKHTDRWEWLLVLAGTRQYATPHAHIYLWAEGDVPREAFQPVVQRFVESCEYPPATGHRNSTESDTISIRGTEQTDTIPRTDDGGSTGATYALTQLAHLPEVDSMDFDEPLWASTVRASEGVHHFRKSSYDVWEEVKNLSQRKPSKISLRTRCYLVLCSVVYKDERTIEGTSLNVMIKPNYNTVGCLCDCMVHQYIPKPVRNRLSGTIAASVYNSVYKEYQIRFNELTKAEYHTPVGSFEMLVPDGHRFLVKSGPDGEEHEPLLAQELKHNLKEDTIFYDIGARWGYHTLLLMQLGLSESQIHAFEGDKLAYSILQQNHSQAANLTKAYISDSDGELSLDQYMTNHSHPDIIKIDVEGAEVDVLRGLKGNLNSELLLFIEVHPKRIEEFDHKPDELIQLLRKHGYKLEVGDHRQKQEKLVPFSRIENPPSDNYLLKAQRV